jgi:phosphate-selective porin OprO/OprP
VDTGVIDGDRAIVGGAEAAWVKGPLSLQSELLISTGDDNLGNTFRFGGAYLSGSWVLTGESRLYDRKIGVFKGIDPSRNFSFRNRTWGAWQWAVRASHLDLTDGNIEGGVMNIVSTGLNCYLTKRNRIMLDCGYADIKDSATPGDLLYLQTRFQVEF